MGLISVQQAVEDYKAGKFVILVDDENRENEGDLTIAAEKVTPAAINFMSKHGRGLICLAIATQRLDELRIPPMVQQNTSKFSTAFAVSIEAKQGVSTGISAHDRATTIRTVIDPTTRPEDVVSPGHVFPIRARVGGVMVRAGHTEAIVDFARLAGLYPAGVICEIMNEDGSMARLPELEAISDRFGINIATIADLIVYRRRHEKLVEKVTETHLPTQFGDFRAVAYRSLVDSAEHLALVKGDISADEPVLVRVHSECMTGDVFHSQRCDCGDQVQLAMQMIADEGRGVLLYMRQEGRGIGFHNKLKAYALQDKGMDTVEANLALGFPADLRDYGTGAQILADLGLTKIKLLTNNPKKMVGLASYGLEVVTNLPIIAPVTPYNRRYLRTKQEKLGHMLNIEEKEV